MKNRFSIGLILSLSAAVVACSNEPSVTTDEKAQTEVVTTAEVTTPVAEEAVPEEAANLKPFLADAAALQKAEDTLNALPQFEGKPLSAFQNVNFYDGEGSTARIEVDIQDPNNEKNVDHYTYDADTGTWSEPQPVQISGDGDMSGNLTPLTDMKFADIANVVIPMWHEKAAVESFEPNEASPSLVTMALFVPNQDRFWQTSMENERSSYFLRVNLDGSLKSFKKN